MKQMSFRLVKIKKLLVEKKADVFWMPNNDSSGQPGTEYISGFSGSDSHLLVTKNKAYLLTDGRYLAVAKKEARGYVIVDVAEQSLTESFKKIMAGVRKKTVLIDGLVTSFSLVERVRKKILNVKITNTDGILKELRRVKTPEEIKILKKAALISCAAFKKFLPFIKAGVTEKWLASKLAELLLDCGAEAVAFDLIVASGKNAAFPHIKPTDKKLQRGELVIVDFGAAYKGYVSDMTRTVAIGKISPKLAKMYEAVCESQEAGCCAIRAGIAASEIDKVCRSTLAKYGFEKYFIHATGHGIGMEVHELPVISQKQDKKLEAGEVVTCEPGVYIEGVGGVRIEDSLAITNHGYINLTGKISKKLLRL